jgi:uncharacterized protein YecT (DUF1311 family)
MVRQSKWPLFLFILTSPPAASFSAGTQVEFRLPAPKDALNRCLDTGLARLANMPAIFDCYSEEFQRRDKVLNESYRALIEALPPMRRRALVASQRQWLVRRDPICIEQAEREMGVGGQDTKLAGFQCVLDETNKRINWFRRYGQR